MKTMKRHPRTTTTSDLLEIEREAQAVDAEQEAQEEQAAAELQRTIREHTAVYHLPTASEAADEDRVVPPSELRAHVESILEVLADFQPRREPGRARTEYLERLTGYLAELYGYLPELVEYFLTMFAPAEALEFLDASDKPRPLVIRTNTLKTRRKDLAAALIKRGVSLDPLAAWSKVGLKIVESPVPVGATPEYLAGHYMLQSAASLCPVLALQPQPHETCLDMSAAPGGKTSYMAQLMRNTGVLIANDLKATRQKATVANLHRLGVRNVITCARDGRQLGATFRNRFDRVLLDAPCSGLGVISRDPSVKVQRTMADVQQCAHLQKELLLAAIDALKWKTTNGSSSGKKKKKNSGGTGGDGGGDGTNTAVLVYSTCSVSVLENEEVVQYALQKRDIRVVDTGLGECGARPGFVRYQQKRFHPSMAHCRRFYPHTVNMDGFFVCKIIKLSDKRPVRDEKQAGEEETVPVPVEGSSKSTTTRKKRPNSAATTRKKSREARSANRHPRKRAAWRPKRPRLPCHPRRPTTRNRTRPTPRSPSRAAPERWRPMRRTNGAPCRMVL